MRGKPFFGGQRTVSPAPLSKKAKFYFAKLNGYMNSTTTLDKEHISNWSAVRNQRTFRRLNYWRTLQ